MSNGAETSVLRLRPLAAFLSLALALCLLGLWSARSQSIPLRRVTNTSLEGLNLNPSLSGNGRRIAFESTEDVARAGGVDFFRAVRADVSTTSPTFVQMGGARAPAPGISQDGTFIAFSARENPLGTNADGNFEIFLFDGATLRQITNTTPADASQRTRHGNFQPSLSDDGRFIAFSSNRNLTNQNSDANFEVFIFDRVSNAFTQLTNTAGGVGSTDAKISGDGARVAYIRDSSSLPAVQRDLMLQDRTGGVTRLLANDVTNLALTFGRAISDDGTRVVFAGDTAANTSQVFLFDGRINAVRQLTSLETREADVPLHPTISGDGKRIAFATRRPIAILDSNGDRSIELYTLDLPTGQFAQVTDAPREADGFQGSTRVAEVVSSLNDDGSIVAFNFPRALSGEVDTGLENNSEIYVSGTAARPTVGALEIVNGASFGHEPSTTEAVAPDSLAVAMGGALSFTTEEAQASGGSFPTTLGGTTVRVNGRLAQIAFVSPTRVDFIVPHATEIGTATVVITNEEGFQSSATIKVLTGAPGIFTETDDGLGIGKVVNAQTGQPGPFDPSNGQLRLIISMTGVRNAATVTAKAGGQALTVESVTASPDEPGRDEVRVLVPADLRGAGEVDLIVRADGRDSNPVKITFSGTARREIVINEVLADPPDDNPNTAAIEGDANRDGVRDSADDEFVELVNATGGDIDIGGYQLLTRSSSSTTDRVHHTFAPGTIFPSGSAIVVFGGGNFNPNNPAFGGAQVFKASEGELSLVNSGGVVTLRDETQTLVNIFTYGGSTGLNGGSNQSLTRSPDAGVGTSGGNFVLHTTAPGSNNKPYSPGTRVNGSPFATVVVARIEVTPGSANIAAGQKQQFTATAYRADGRPIPGLIFTWESSNTAVATIDQNGLATGRGAGTTQITASARGVRSSPATLTVRVVPLVLTSIEVTPSTATIPTGGTQQFTARGLDQFGNEMTGLTFTWESTNTAVATVDQNGLAQAVNLGQTTIKASAQGKTGTATLIVTRPAIIFNEVLADPPGSNETDLDGDANHDNMRSASQDEFVELVNSGTASVNISGWTVRTRALNTSTETLRHTFAAGTTVQPGNAIVVFGGGDFETTNPVFGCAQVVKASSGRLSLANGGMTVVVLDASGNLKTQFTYGSAVGLNGGANQSLTRSPDITGDFVGHTTAAGANGKKFSPGTRVDGTPFGNSCPGILTSITISPASQSVVGGKTTQFTAQARDQFGRTMKNVTITFSSDNTNVATIESVTKNPTTGIATATVRGRNQGTAHITASATDGTTTVTSSPATLTVTPPPPRVTRIDVSPATATINRGNKQQFTASAFNGTTPVTSGVTVTWTSSNTNVATIDQNGLATGVGIGTTTIKATAPDGLGGTVSDTATLIVRVPLVINEINADVPTDNTATPAIEGDTNRDGVRSSGDDEFLELLNNSSASVDISGVIIADATSNRFTIPAGTILAAGRALLIFGGGNPPANDPAFGGALVIAIPGSLSLNDTGDTVNVKLPVGANEVVIATQTYGGTSSVPSASNQSLTRSPDAAIGTTGGSFIPHTTATNAAGRTSSPGTRADGTPFGSPPITRISITPASASIFAGDSQGFTARAFSNTNGPEVEVLNVSFIWDSSNTNVATVNPLTGRTTTATGVSAGSVTIRAQAGGQQKTAPLTVKGIVTSIDVTPQDARVVVGQAITFTATARDKDGNVVPGITFVFSLRNPQPANAATILSTTANTVRVRGDQIGSVVVVASYTRSGSPTVEGTSQLQITPPPPRVTSIDVSPATATINRGQTQQFTANAFNGSTPVSGVNFTWTSSNPAVATINSSGLATGVGIGTTTIKATAPDGQGGTVSDTATLTVRVPLVINEILADPPGSAATDLLGDANRDGTRSSDDDEFVELLNNTNAPVNISGVIISDSTGNRFTFPANTTLAAGRAVVIFGGGTPPVNDPAFGGALVLTVANSATSSTTLSLGNSGDTVTVKLPVSGADVVIDTHTYGSEAGHDESLTQSPDAAIGTTGGAFVRHKTATNAAGRSFSPGTRADGTPFGSPAITRISITPASASIFTGNTQLFTARAFSNANGPEVEVLNVSFIWDSSNTGVATVSPQTGRTTNARGVAAGSTTIRAQAGGQQKTAALTVKAVVASIELLPATATIPATSSQTFTATAKDANGNTIPGITFVFSLRNPSPANAATITGTTANTVTVRGNNQGSVTVVASYTRPNDGVTIEDTSQLTIGPPPPRVTSIVVSPATATINRGNTQQFTATAFNGSNPVSGVTVTWTSSNTAVATINQNGLATGVGIGTTTITATAPDGLGGTVSDTSTLTVRVPLVINEALPQVPTDNATTTAIEGDSNRDGVRSSDDDEFVELLNNTNAPVDISGVVISDSTANRFTFPAGTILAAGRAVVVFGGGTPPPNDPAFGGALIFTTSSLSLADGGDTITVKLSVSGSDVVIDSLAYGSGNPVPAPGAQSLTRSPDAAIGSTGGAFDKHTLATNSAGRVFSPGTRVDGTPFGSPPITRIEVTPASATIDPGQTQGFIARAFSNTGGPEVEIQNVSFIWESSNTGVATVNPTTGVSTTATAVGPGSTSIIARAGGQQGAATLNVTSPPPVLTSVTITPASATINIGGTQQFTAQARDQFGQPIGGVTITFASDNTTVATVDSVSPTSGTGSATATVTGHSNGTAGITATADDGSTTVTSTPATLTVKPVANPGDIVISEFRFRGSNGANDEFIELYNRTTAPIDISGYRIYRSNNAGSRTLHATIDDGKILGAGCHYLLTNSNATGPYNDGVAGDETYGTGITDDGGIAFTLPTSDGITGIIDQVGLSSGSAYKEGTPLTSLGNTTASNIDRSYEREPGGAAGNGQDTNDNAADFTLINPSQPQNLSSGCVNTSTADLSITKTDSPDPVASGSDVTYTITVTNNGPGVAQSVVVTDNLPTNATFVSCSSTGGGVCNAGTGNNRTITFSSLDIGESAVITLVATANGTGSTTITNTASVDAATTDPVVGNDSDTETTTVQTPADLEIPFIQGAGGVNVGENISISMSLENDGPSTATNVTVQVDVPAGLEYVSPHGASAGTTYDPNTGVWTIPSIASGTSKSLSITFKVLTSGNKTITAEVSASDQPDPDSTPNNNDPDEDDQKFFIVFVHQADLSLTKTVDNATPTVGDQVVFTISLHNTGQPATGVQVTDQLPAGLTYDSSTVTQGTYDSDTGVWNVGTVSSSATATLTITANVTATGTHTNTAEVTASNVFDPDSTPNNHVAAEDDQDSAIITVGAVAQADLSLTKTVNKATPNIGERVIFTVNLSNGGTDPATGVQVTDQLPAGLAFVSSTVTQGTYVSGTGVWTVGNVAVGSNVATLTITATVQTTGAKTNTAEVTASGLPDPDSTPNNHVAAEDDQASVTVTGASNLVINEVHTQAQASPPANANDFVELYNKSLTQAIDISGLVISVRAGGTTENTFTLPASTVIQPDSYLIIVNGTITYGVNADFNASSVGWNLTAASGGVKIVLNDVKVDGLAYQSGSNVVSAYFLAFGEGNVFTSSTSSGQQDYVRSPDGADSNDNATDFRRSGTNSTSVTPKAENPTITP